MNNTIYLVTGAAGFLGSNVCAQLLERGERVRAFVLEGDKAAQYIPESVEIVYGNLCNKESLRKLFTVEEGVETVCVGEEYILGNEVISFNFSKAPREGIDLKIQVNCS